MYTPDNLHAFVLIADNPTHAFPSEADILSCLTAHGVIVGISTAMVKKIVAEKIFATRIEVATGIPPVQPKPGRCEGLIDLESRGKPKIVAGGRVDHREIQYVIAVRKGMELVKRNPPIPGTDGQNIFGTIIPAARMVDALLPLGRGTTISDRDTNLLIAAVDGALTVRTDGIFEIRTEKVIESDIDYTTGNISFAGDIVVKGSVRTGFELEVDGDVCIMGNVEDAKIRATGAIEIRGGVSGGNQGVIKCGKTLKLHHVERFTIETCDLIVSEDIVNTTIKAQRTIGAKNIVGGLTCAGISIVVASCGTSAETRTRLHILGSAELLAKKYSLLKETMQLTTAIGTTKQKLFDTVSKGMNADGVLAQTNIAMIAQLQNTKISLVETQNQRETEIASIEELLSQFPEPFIKIKNAHPGTLIKFENAEREINQDENNLFVRLVDGRLVFDKAAHA